MDKTTQTPPAKNASPETPTGEDLTPEANDQLQGMLDEMHKQGETVPVDAGNDRGKAGDDDKDKTDTPPPKGDGKDASDDKGKGDAPKKLSLTQRQREAAKQLGLDEDTLQLMGEAKAKAKLDDFAKLFDRASTDLGRKAEADQDAKDKGDGAEGSDADDKAKDEDGDDAHPPEGKKGEFSASELTDETGYISEEKVAEALQRTAQSVQDLQAQLASVTKTNQQLVGRLERADIEDFWLSVDNPRFGSGATADLDPDGPEAKARNDYEQVCRTYLDGARRAQQEIDLPGVLRRLLATAGTDEIRSDERRKATEESRRSRRGAHGGGSARPPKPPTTNPDDVALDIVRKSGKGAGLWE